MATEYTLSEKELQMLQNQERELLNFQQRTNGMLQAIIQLNGLGPGNWQYENGKLILKDS